MYWSGRRSLTANPPEPPELFASLPGPVSPQSLERGWQRLRARYAGKDPGASQNLDEILAGFSMMQGGRVQVFKARGEKAALDEYLAGSGVLDDFILLANAEDEQLLAFAAHWGPLGLCRHLKPWTHSLTRRSMTTVEPVCIPLGVTRSGGCEVWEPIDVWKTYSRNASKKS